MGSFDINGLRMKYGPKYIFNEYGSTCAPIHDTNPHIHHIIYRVMWTHFEVCTRPLVRNIYKHASRLIKYFKREFKKNVETESKSHVRYGYFDSFFHK